jgi:hypothetical protein
MKKLILSVAVATYSVLGVVTVVLASGGGGGP